MKKKLIATGLILVILLAPVSCAAPPELPDESHTQYPFAPGRYFWPKPDWALDEPSLGELPADNPESLRLLTDEEKDRVVEIALNTSEASAWREKEPEYRAELIWCTPEDPTVKNSRMLSFRYYKALYEIYSELYWRPGSLPKSAIWYPGVRIGFGIPQQFVVEVAVDLEKGQSVYVNSYTDVNRESNLRWLTDEEKNTVIEIALNTPEAKKWLEKESTYRVGLSWKAIWEDGYSVFPYEVVEEGISLYVPESELEFIYPNISIRFGESRFGDPAEWIVSVAVDLKRGKVVSSEGYPNLSHPDRFKQAEPAPESAPLAIQPEILDITITGYHSTRDIEGNYDPDRVAGTFSWETNKPCYYCFEVRPVDFDYLSNSGGYEKLDVSAPLPEGVKHSWPIVLKSGKVHLYVLTIWDKEKNYFTKSDTFWAPVVPKAPPPPAPAPAPPPSEAQAYKKVTAPLSLNEEDENATVIPYGSIIYHWANGITEVYGPDNERIFIARDSEATMIAAPGGLKPATHIYHIPSGALVDEAGLPPPSDAGSKITKVYLDGAKILTIIEKSESFPVDE